jgi:hypothetical protein
MRPIVTKWNAHTCDHAWGADDRCTGCGAHKSWPLAKLQCPNPAPDKKGKRPGGKKHMAKLNEEQVREIRRRAAAGDAKDVLAREYGVGCTTIRDVVNRNTYRNVR